MIQDFMEMSKEAYEKSKCSFEKLYQIIYNNYTILIHIVSGYADFSYELGCALDGFIPEANKPPLQFALLRIHEKAIKIFTESLSLIAIGSASGAMARWRTLYELSVISKVLEKIPELAPKYIAYLNTANYKCFKKLNTYKEHLNLAYFDSNRFDELKKAFDENKSAFGWEGKKPYEWAKCDEIKAPSLFNLAEYVGLEKFYAYVDESHAYNHASIFSMISARGENVPNENIKCMFSPLDLDLPLQLIVTSLHQVNVSCILAYYKLDSSDKEKLCRYLNTNADFPAEMIKYFEEKEVKHNAD